MSGLCGPGVTTTMQVQVWTWTWNTPPPGYHEESTIWSWRQLGWNPQRRTQRVRRGHVLCLLLCWPWSYALCLYKRKPWQWLFFFFSSLQFMFNCKMESMSLVKHQPGINFFHLTGSCMRMRTFQLNNWINFTDDVTQSQFNTLCYLSELFL